jgi:sterol desaturase/sphingolipid hydroxylase (fatty acid hydroxylase superfamily)
MIGIPVALLYANAFEWWAHKHLLHGLGKKKDSFFAFHFYDHHRASRKHAMRDDGYAKPFPGGDPQRKEALLLTALVAVHAPLLPIAPFFTATVAYSAVHYWRTHKRAHLDPEWAREHLPWHVEHHLGRDQDANWCVTHPFFDELMGTATQPWTRGGRARGAAAAAGS